MNTTCLNCNRVFARHPLHPDEEYVESCRKCVGFIKKQRPTIEMGMSVFFQKTKHTIDLLIADMEPLVSPLNSLGMSGVESAKQQWKLKEYISKLKQIKEIIGDV